MAKTPKAVEAMVSKYNALYEDFSRLQDRNALLAKKLEEVWIMVHGMEKTIATLSEQQKKDWETILNLSRAIK